MSNGKGLSVTAALLMCLVLFGCTGNEPAVTSEPPGSGAETGDPPAAAVQEAAGAQPAPSEADGSAPLESEGNKSPIEVASPDDGTTSAAPESSGAVEDAESGMTESEARQKFYKELYDVHDTFDVKHPTLMGLDMRSTLEAVKTRFGEPVDTYALPDESEKASVYAYPGFSVGISDGHVLFVEVSTTAINPGLNGLRVGGTADDAVAAIGEPTTRSEYVLTYKNNGVVLKFDIDPKNDTIQSIKLFPEET
ncbi:hypothetical protein [Paenibacillus thermotolerans]|uniref:hypothetical protein n=1 Tax=Paenibacillus thermotolerans TaxID=3027807 RepID=UPI0023674560|nr:MULTISPECIES: hypothetical protein [unclassified Paenibacillus]